MGEETINSGSENEPLVQASSEGYSESLRSRRVATRKVLRGFGAAICIILVVASWAIMAEKLQDLGKTFHQPFFQTYWIHSSYSIPYVVWKIWLLFPGGYSCNRAGEGTLTNTRTLFLTGSLLAALSFFSGLLWYISLSKTSVSANTAIYQSSSAMVFILSVPLLRERVTAVKILSVAFTIAGVCLVSLFGGTHGGGGSNNSTNSTELAMSGALGGEQLESDEETITRSTPLGYVCVLFSMILYAAYETFYKKFGTTPDDTAPIWNSVRVIGYVGVHTLAMYWPIIIVVHFIGVERFRLPNLDEFRLLVGMTCLDMVFNGALLVCIALSTPLFASVGSVLTLPATVFLDWIMKHHVMSWQSFLGVAAIVLGFILLVFSEYWGHRKKSKESGPTIKQVLHSFHGSVNAPSSSKIKLKSCIKHYLI